MRVHWLVIFSWFRFIHTQRPYWTWNMAMLVHVELMLSIYSEHNNLLQGKTMFLCRKMQNKIKLWERTLKCKWTDISYRWQVSSGFQWGNKRNNTGLMSGIQKAFNCWRQKPEVLRNTFKPFFFFREVSQKWRTTLKK